MIRTRRLTALAIDLFVIAAMGFVIVVAGHITGLFSVKPTLVFMLLVGGMVALECGRRQTPGKLVMGLVIKPLNDGRIGSYEITLRMMIIAISIVAAACCSDLVAVYHMQAATVTAVTVFLSVLVTSVWPISVLVGRGGVGLHDLLAGTCVASPHSQVPQPPRWFVTISVTLSAVLAALSATGAHGFLDVAQRIPDTTPEYRQFHIKLGEAVRSIEGHEELVRRYGCTTHRWSDVDLDRFRFDSNVEGLGAQINLNDRSFKLVVSCRIETTFSGVLNGDFQRSLAHRLSSEVSTDVVFDFNYAADESFGPLHVALEKRLVVLGLTSSDNRPWALFVEPDQSVTFGVGIDVFGLMP